MQVKVNVSEPGLIQAEAHPTEVLRDGVMQVTLEWSPPQPDDYFGTINGYWFARLLDDDREKRAVFFMPNADGASREEALAHLAIAAYSGLIESRPEVPAADPKAGDRDYTVGGPSNGARSNSGARADGDEAGIGGATPSPCAPLSSDGNMGAIGTPLSGATIMRGQSLASPPSLDGVRVTEGMVERFAVSLEGFGLLAEVKEWSQPVEESVREILDAARAALRGAK